MTFADAMLAEPSTAPFSGMSDDELITRFAQLDRQIKEFAAEKREIGLELAGKAYEKKQNQNTVHLESTGGTRLKVEFGVDYEYDMDGMKVVFEALGPEQFDQLFKTELKYTAKKRNLNGFMNTVSTNERTETAKDLIREALKTKDKAPYVSVERS